jgi:hypothetical protein
LEQDNKRVFEAKNRVILDDRLANYLGTYWQFLIYQQCTNRGVVLYERRHFNIDDGFCFDDCWDGKSSWKHRPRQGERLTHKGYVNAHKPGRILALLAFSGFSAILVISVGLVCGGRFFFTGTDFIESLAFILLIFVGSAGIGMLIGTFVKHVHGAIMSGVGLTVVSAALSGVMTPYQYLPSVLQNFARIYPISSANSVITYLLVGEEYAGYNPLNFNQIALTTFVALLLFILGLIAYSKICWKKV